MVTPACVYARGYPRARTCTVAGRGYYGTCAALLGHIVSKSYCGVGPRSVGSVAGERTGTNGLEAASAAAVVGAAAADSQLAVD